MKNIALNCETNFKTSSELSMLVGSTRSHQNLDHGEPKLEDFLGGHSFNGHDQKLHECNGIPASYDASSDYLFSNCSLQLPATASAVPTTSNGGGRGSINNSNSIGLSMIKSWLRNQPAPPQQPQENKNDVASVGTLTNAQTLSLSMSTGSQSSSPLPLVMASGGSRAESSSSENKQKATALDGQSGAVEAVPRKSIDTFGQRTSIYRGVTRFLLLLFSFLMQNPSCGFFSHLFCWLFIW